MIASQSISRSSALRRVAAAFAAAGALLVVTGLVTATAEAQSSAGGVELFDAADYGGPNFPLYHSVSDLAQYGSDWETRISSLRVRNGTAVAVYSQPDYSGRCETFTSQDAWLGDNAIGNDTIRSVKIGYTCSAPVPGRVVVTDIAVIARATPGMACPHGYSKKLQDLNQGAGGDYVYLCVKWGPRTTEAVMSRVEVYKSYGASENEFYCSFDGGRSIEGNLDSGTGGTQHLMFCAFSRTRSEPLVGVQDIDFLVSDDDMVCYLIPLCDEDEDITPACARKLGRGAYGQPLDLNASSNRKYIYLCVKPTDAAVPITQVDDRPPTIELIKRTPANAAGWNRSAVNVTWRCTAGGAPLMSEPSVTQELHDDGENQSAVARCTDLSGHEVTDKVTGINIDTTPPDMRLHSRTPANAAGWNRADVVVTWTCDDGLSGPEQKAVSRTVQTEGADQAATASCRDRAGNERFATEHEIDIDRTPPEPALVSRTPRPMASGWNSTDVSIVWSCADALSGVDPGARTVTETVTGEGRGLSATGRCHDRAGNVGADTQRVDIDRTAPEIAATRTPEPNAASWNNTDVTVSFSCADELSGLAEPCPADVEFTNEGAGQIAVGKVTDAAGNSAKATVEVNIDKTAPTFGGARTPAPNAHGWNNADVTVRFGCKDALSGVPDCPGDVVVADEGSDQSVARMVTDRAGNQASAKVSGINIDKTAPAIAARRTPEPNAAGWNDTPVTVTFGCKDRLAGILTCPEPLVLGADGAGQAAAGTAVDRAGNTATTRVEDINIDTSAPALTCMANPSTLWAPNHELVPVDVTVELADARSGAAGFVLESATSSEPDNAGGDGSTTGDVVDFEIGTPDVHGSLRAERAGTDPGRTYTLSYRGSDSAGNSSTCDAEVRVAHDQG